MSIICRIGNQLERTALVVLQACFTKYPLCHITKSFIFILFYYAFANLSHLCLLNIAIKRMLLLCSRDSVMYYNIASIVC